MVSAAEIWTKKLTQLCHQTKTKYNRWQRTRNRRKRVVKIEILFRFPDDGAIRNNVYIPPGRIFFSCVCFTNPNNNDVSLDHTKYLVSDPQNAGIINNGGFTTV